MTDDPPTVLSYEFADWDDVDPGDGIAFNILLKAQALGVRSENGVVMRLALIRDSAHANAVAAGREEPELAYIRCAAPMQARLLGEALIQAANLVSGNRH